MLQQLRREHKNGRHSIQTTGKPVLRRERTTETPQGVLAGKRLTPRVDASPNPFVTRETTISPLSTHTAVRQGSSIEWKDVLRQAETLFMRGEYEQALVWFHRGRRLRPKAKEFQNGILKCERVINSRVPIPVGRESMLSETSTNSPPRSRASTRNTNHSSVHVTTRSLPTPHLSNRSGDSSATPVSPWLAESECGGENDNEKKHIRKLKRDKMYLKDLLREMDKNVSKSSEVQNIVEQSLKYLDTRSKFWKQTVPVHAMRNMQTRSFQFPVPSTSVRDDASLPSVNGGMRLQRAANSSNINHYVLREVFKVHQDFLEERYRECIGRAERCIQTIQIHKASEIMRKYDLVANLYALKGNSHFQMEQYKEALRCYHRDLEIAKEKDMTEAKSRALENIGRVYARIGEFDKAVNVWKEKSSLCRSDGERAWLFHEIGYCYLSKREYSKAKQFGEMAYASAEHTADMVWQLNASILIAQAEARMSDLQNSFETFKYALDLAKLIGDKQEQANIQEAMASIQKAIREEKEERRRKLIENKANKPRERAQLPNGLVLTDEDLFDDEDDCQDSPEYTVEDHMSNIQYNLPKGGKVRKRLHGSSEFTPAYQRRFNSPHDDESSPDPLQLTGGTIPLSNRAKQDRRTLHEGEMVKAATREIFNIEDSTVQKSNSLKSILKNTAGPYGHSINIWSDLNVPQDHENGNLHLLPAIAKSNTQIGFIRPEIHARHINPHPPKPQNHKVRDYHTQVEESDATQQQPKSVRFSEENELFRLPDIPPYPPSESTVASEPEAPPAAAAPRILRSMLEAEGYFIGKYA